jgi:hypothetical protein
LLGGLGKERDDESCNDRNNHKRRLQEAGLHNICVYEDTSSENIRKACGAGFGRERGVNGADRGLLTFRPGADTDVQSDAESRTRKVTSPTDYRGACPFTEKTLNAIYSYSYRGDSDVENLILCHCAEPRKSPTIGQLQEIVTIRCADW